MSVLICMCDLLVCLVGTQKGAAVIQNTVTPGQDSLCTVSKTDPAANAKNVQVIHSNLC